MKLVAGLGNPGEKYKCTRHNVGFMVADRLAANLGEGIGPRGVKFKKAYLGYFAVVPFPRGEETGILKPRTFMNRSGRSVGRAMRDNGLSVDDLVVAHDDLDLPLGRIKVKFGGGAGGHKGVSNTIDALGSPDFIRVRIGIDKPTGGKDASDYVLERFTPAERVILENEVLPRAVEAIKMAIERGAQAAMNEFNG